MLDPLPGITRKVVVDTNVILFDALAIGKFKDADIHIPISVIEEVDRFKRDPGENGRNARHFSRYIDVLRAKGPLADGVQLENTNARVFVNQDLQVDGLPKELDKEKADNRILMTAMGLHKRYPNMEVELVTKDINLRIKADVFGINAKDYEPERVSFEDMYEGYEEIEVDPEAINRFYADKILIDESIKLRANEYVILRDSSNPNHSAIGRFSAKENGVVPLLTPHDGIWGIHPRNVEQTFAMDCLLNDEIMFVSLIGKAGTGKTLMALAAGLYKTLD
ncbi:MAG: PIN domain-containing protein, partial [Bdellovibrionaceae bacterium]|nr:PIN domain-containing protein [Pseudobdellovibrionaceae bacterium]